MKLRSGIAFLLMIVLVVLSVGFGAYRGWSRERAKVEESYVGLESMLRTRVESAYNVLAVAKRHVKTGDSEGQRLYQQVEQTKNALEGDAALSAKADANTQLTAYVNDLLAHLAALDSVRQDSRDNDYVKNYLPQMMEQSEEKTASANYNSAAREFNKKLNGTFSGFLAKLLGIKPAEEFIPVKEG